MFQHLFNYYFNIASNVTAKSIIIHFEAVTLEEKYLDILKMYASVYFILFQILVSSLIATNKPSKPYPTSLISLKLVVLILLSPYSKPLYFMITRKLVQIVPCHIASRAAKLAYIGR